MRKRRAYRNISILVAACLSLLYSSFRQPASSSSTYTVFEVVDGDTIRISKGVSLRYIGLDTPELGERLNNVYQYHPQPFAQAALALNKQLVEGKQIRIEYDTTRKDAYGRILGYCFVKNPAGNEIMVNEKIIEEGLGFIFPFPPNTKYGERFAEAQRRARLQRKGMWQSYVPVDIAGASEWVGKTGCVRGRVASSYNSGKAYFLNFVQEKGQRFTVVIFEKDMFYFQRNNIFPGSYVGKLVDVTGKVKRYKDQIEIIVRDPTQIAVVSDDIK